jgi:hypothetical protein
MFAPVVSLAPAKDVWSRVSGGSSTWVKIATRLRFMPAFLVVARWFKDVYVISITFGVGCTPTYYAY